MTSDLDRLARGRKWGLLIQRWLEGEVLFRTDAPLKPFLLALGVAVLLASAL